MTASFVENYQSPSTISDADDANPVSRFIVFDVLVGQYNAEGILDIVDRIHETSNTHITWVPGYKNMEGNEKADKATKTATQSPLSSG